MQNLSFSKQIENRIGLIEVQTDGEKVTQFLDSSIIDVLNKVKAVNPDAYSRTAVQTAVDSTASTRIDGDIVSAYGSPQTNAGGETAYRRPAVEIPFELSEVAKDITSIHYQSPYSPAWYRNGRNIGIVPDGGIILHIGIPTTNAEDVEIYSMPVQFTSAVVLGACIKYILYHITKRQAENMPSYDSPTWPADPTFTLPLPDNLTPPTFTYTATHLVDEFSGESIGDTLIRASFPAYMIPILEPTTLTTMDPMDIPDPPSVPASLQHELNFTEPPPTYEVQSLEMVDFPSDIQALDLDAITIPDPPTPNFTAETYTQHDVHTSDLTLPGPPVWVQPKILGISEALMEQQPDVSASVIAAIGDARELQDVLSAIWNYIVVEEDPDQATAATGYLSQVIALYNGAMANENSKFQAATGEYQATIARQMDVVRLAQADDQKQKDANFQAAVSLYEKQLAVHQAEVIHYTAEVNEATTTWSSNNITWKLAKWNSEQGHKFTEFTNKMSNAMNRFNSEVGDYDKKWAQAIKVLDQDNTNLAQILAQFDKEMARYTASVSKVTQEYQQNEVLLKWEKYKFDTTQNLSNFNAQMASNMNTYNEQSLVLQTELTIAQANSNNIQSALAAKMAASTELAKNNEAQRLAQDLQTWSAELAEYQNRMAQYTAEVTAESGKFQAVLGASSNKMTDNMNKFSTSFQTFQHEQQAWEKMLGILKQEYAESVGVMIQNKGE